ADALFDDKLNVSDQIDAYSKTQDDALLLLKADKTQLADYVDLTSTQTITGQKQFNSNITAASFTKSGADNTVVLLGAGGTKPLSEFSSGSVDDSNYVKKTGQTLQVIKGYLRKSLEDLDGDEPSEEDEDYITKGEVANQYVGIWGNQQIIGTKSFYDNVTANGFIKKNGTNQQVLLANGTTKPLSEFGGGSVDDSNYVKKTGQELQIIHGVLRKDDEELSVSEYDEDYLTRGDIYNTFVSSYDNQSIYGTKTFNSNVNAAGFAKTGKDDTSVLLAGGGDTLISSLGGAQMEDITDKIRDWNMSISPLYKKLSRLGSLYLLFLQVKPLAQFNAGINPKICEFGTASEVISPTGTSSQPFYINFTPPTGTNYTVHIVNRNLLMNQDTIWGTDQAVVITTFWIL
ncbi:MAG: hypothetical protein EZS28_041608, partial [Streblomastix strix]